MSNTIGIINRHHKTVNGFKPSRGLLVRGLLLIRVCSRRARLAAAPLAHWRHRALAVLATHAVV
eukprot:scaffold72363_cov60-Phaeocystis_antarctica.AAC.2